MHPIVVKYIRIVGTTYETQMVPEIKQIQFCKYLVVSGIALFSEKAWDG